MRKITMIIIVTIAVAMVTSCEDEVKDTGVLSLQFQNYTEGMNVLIFALENTDVPIESASPPSTGRLQIELNPGNYFVSIQASQYYENVACQVRPLSTTSISWNESNVAVKR